MILIALTSPEDSVVVLYSSGLLFVGEIRFFVKDDRAMT